MQTISTWQRIAARPSFIDCSEEFSAPGPDGGEFCPVEFRYLLSERVWYGLVGGDDADDRRQGNELETVIHAFRQACESAPEGDVVTFTVFLPRDTPWPMDQKLVARVLPAGEGKPVVYITFAEEPAPAGDE